MICLIRNLTEISVGDVLPVASDTSEGADLYRLKHYRNMIVHHWDGTLSDKKFEECWTDISQAIVRLGGTSFQQTCSDLKVSRMNNNDEEILKELRNIEISSNPVPRGVRKINGEIIEDWEKDKVAETRAIKRIAQLIDTQNTVVAVGSSGCGKSTSIHYVALQLYHHQGYDILPVYSPEEVRQYYDPDSDPDDSGEYNKPPLYVASGKWRYMYEEAILCNASVLSITTSIRMFCDHNATYENLFKTHTLTPVYIAAMFGHIDIVKLLLEKNCNLNSGDLGSNEYLCDEPILYVAASNGHAEIVKLLLEYGCNPNVRNKFNTTPLHEASCQGHFETVKVLLENNSDTCLINKENDSPLLKRLKAERRF
ncbi:unnamed protein product [Mytilus edulis]|uniref:DZIP3-like HEPN domain-containing protein n=1 Tax=Mytilus edulis TaxID=6550 RepID=A0A8S3TGY7_MYTED|nr:unnamed protein product [Mytilus edulis]